MKKSAKAAHLGAKYYGFLKSQGLVFNDEHPPVQPETKPLSHGCDYPLFKLDRVSPNVVRRRVINRG
jgi:hypothetical protein